MRGQAALVSTAYWLGIFSVGRPFLPAIAQAPEGMAAAIHARPAVAGRGDPALQKTAALVSTAYSEQE